MKRSYAWRNGRLVELTPPEVDALHYVQDDIAEFHSPDGARIRGKAQWREHLKATGSIELGHSDIRAATTHWQKRKDDFKEKLKKAEGVKEAEPPGGEIRAGEWSRLGVEMLNRLYNRPLPDRKTLIKLSIETARDLIKRR